MRFRKFLKPYKTRGSSFREHTMIAGGEQMVKLRILEILEEQGHTKYWLYKRMDMMSYRNFKNIIDNETSSIRFEILDRLSRILEVPVGDLFIQTQDED